MADVIAYLLMCREELPIITTTEGNEEP